MSYPQPSSTTSANVKGLMTPKKVKPKAAPKPHVMQKAK
jgi:hypothetical protein